MPCHGSSLSFVLGDRDVVLVRTAMCITRRWWFMLSIVVRFLRARAMLVPAMPPVNSVNTAARARTTIQLTGE